MPLLQQPLAIDQAHLIHPLHHPTTTASPRIWVEGRGALIKDADGRTVASGSLPQGTSEKAWNLDLGDRRQPTICVMMLDVAGVDSVAHATLSIDGRPPKPIRPNRNMDDIPEVDLK